MKGLRKILLVLVISALIVPCASAGQLDVDGNGSTDALTDGVVILRYLFGFRGTSLTAGAVGTGATRSTAAQIEPYVASLLTVLDIDQSGSADALSDGILLIRYLFGFTDATLVSGVVSPSGARSDTADIQNYIAAVMGLPTFASRVATSPLTVYTGESTSVTFAAALSSPTGITTVNLIETDAQGAGSTVVLTLYDDGDLTKGDDIAGDGIYHNRMAIQPSTTTDKYYRAKLPNSPTTSAVTRLLVAPHLTTQAITDMKSLSSQVSQSITNGLSSGKVWSQIQNDIVQVLAANSAKTAATGLADSGDGVWWVTKQGVLYAVDATLFSSLKGSAMSQTPRQDSIPEALRQERPLIPTFERPYDLSPSGTYSATGIKPSATDVILPSSNRALVIAPYFTFFEGGGGDESNDIAQALQNAGFTVTFHADAAVTLADFKDWSPYGVVAWSSHGDNFYNGLWNLWQNQFGESIPWLGEIFSVPVVLTGITVNDANRAQFESDLVSQRAVLVPMDNQGNAILAITPAFFQTYAGKLPDALVYASSCRSAYNSALGNALLSAGAKTYLGYTDYVSPTFANATGIATFNQLLQGKTTGEVVQVNTTDPYDSHHAKYVRYGATNLTLAGGLKNGTFETGTLAGWTTEGDARIIATLGPLQPPQGLYMSIISTGLGSVSDSQSRIYQAFLVPPTANRLKFRYNVISEEPLEFVGSVYDDKVDARLTVDNATQTLMSESINTSQWSSISGINFAGGDSTVFQTGWKDIDVDVTAYRGKMVTIEFRCYDVGDSIYDTAVVVDNVRIEP